MFDATGIAGGGAQYGNNHGISSNHPGGANVLYGDGSVQFLSESLSFDVLKFLCIRDDGQAIQKPD
jgi:prepilin-type processing-associated H-X9-DG protein